MSRIGLLLLLLSAPAFAQTLDTLESGIFETAGFKEAIVRRAQTCVAQLVRFDRFGESDNTAGQVLLTIDPDAGIIVANSRLQFGGTGFFSILQSVQSLVTIHVRDGQFKIRHTAIKTAIGNSNFTDGTHMKSPTARGAIKKLNALNTNLAACIQQSNAW